MLPSTTYARGLARREIELLERSKDTVFRRHKAASTDLYQRTRNITRKMSPRAFETFARRLAALSDEPALAAPPAPLPRGVAPGTQSIQLACAVKHSISLMDDRTSAEVYQERPLGITQTVATSDGRRFHMVSWIVSGIVSPHLIQRYIERDVGDRVTAKDLAHLTDAAARYASIYLRVATLSRFRDLPHQCVAPYDNGVLVGHITRSDNAPGAHMVTRDKHGLRRHTTQLDNAAIMDVVWRTYLPCEGLSAVRRETLDAVLPALSQAHDALAEDPRIIYNTPYTERVPPERHERARAAVLPFMRAWRDCGAAGFDHHHGDNPASRGISLDSDYEAMLVDRKLAAVQRTREQIWPKEIADSVTR